jgi:hypothetical protein
LPVARREREGTAVSREEVDTVGMVRERRGRVNGAARGTMSFMGEPPIEQSCEETHHPLDYAGPKVERSAVEVRRRRVAVTLGVLWPLAMMFAGTSADRVYVPVGKKVALSAGGAVVAALLFVTSGGRRLGCAFAFLIVAMWMIAVMWFWN